MSRAPYSFDWETYPFSYVKVDRLVRGGTQISWTLQNGFQADSISFTVQWARSFSSDWTDVGTTSNYSYTDPTRRDYSAVLEGFYRVKLTADGSTYYSAPSSFPSTWTAKDLRLCQELRRKELLAASDNFGGQTIWLLGRKFWGTACTQCTSPVSGEVVNPRCSNCYGTGYVGGYHAPYRTKGLLLKTKRVAAPSAAGTLVRAQAVLRCPLLPIVHEQDVVIIDGLDERYFVREIETSVAIKGHPIVQTLSLLAADPDDVIYDLTWDSTYDPEEGEADW